MSLYLKYRPKLVEELDLAMVRAKFNEIIKANKVSHAYLFTGPRGAGKTSAARILARIVNCEHNIKKSSEPCNQCAACTSILDASAVDVVEIDAASNRGIDDIRELKEKIRLAPANLRKKVYIVDEVHMLTTEAFNALLKTLEEPPTHAMFILCTTEHHKVPETIVSRCTSVKFTKATEEELVRSLTRVAKGEGVKTEAEALRNLANSVDGSFRDGVKLLEGLINSGRAISVEEVEKLVSGAEGFNSTILAGALIKQQLTEAVANYRKALNHGVEINYLTVKLIKELRQAILANNGIGDSPLKDLASIKLVELIFQLDEALSKAKMSSVPEVLIEMVIVKWCGNSPKVINHQPPGSDNTAKVKNLNKAIKDEFTTKNQPLETHEMGEAWGEIVGRLGGEGYSLGALISSASPGIIRGDVLTLKMAHDFHRDQLMQEKFRIKVERVVSEIVGRSIRIECVTEEVNRLQKTKTIDNMTEVSPEDNELVEAAEEIFKKN